MADEIFVNPPPFFYHNSRSQQHRNLGW